MAIENSAPNRRILSTFVESSNVFDCHLSGVFLKTFIQDTLSPRRWLQSQQWHSTYSVPFYSMDHQFTLQSVAAHPFFCNFCPFPSPYSYLYLLTGWGLDCVVWVLLRSVLLSLCQMVRFCLIWFFMSHQQSFSYIGTGLPGLNLY